jgi:hypothetical protein
MSMVCDVQSHLVGVLRHPPHLRAERTQPSRAKLVPCRRQTAKATQRCVSLLYFRSVEDVLHEVKVGQELLSAPCVCGESVGRVWAGYEGRVWAGYESVGRV